MVVVRGEAGIGKTSLWRWALQRGRGAGAGTLVTRATEEELPGPIVALVDLFDGIAGCEDTLAADVDLFERGRRVLAAVRRLSSSSPLVVAIDSRRRSRSTCSPPTPPRTRSRSAPARSSRRAPVRLRDAVLHRDGEQRRRGPPALPLARRPGGAAAAAGAGRSPRALEVELGEEFVGASPGQTAVLLAGEAIVGHGTIAAAA